MDFIKNSIDTLRQEGYRDEQIAVLVRYRGDLEPIQKALTGYDVRVHPVHSFKGLEMEVVFLPHLQKTFSREDEETSERWLLYMALSRARSRLYMSYCGRLPRAYEALRREDLADFVE